MVHFMTNHDAILIRVLAMSDAVRLPIRDWSGNAGANRASAIERLDTQGVPFRANATDDAARKAGERELVALATEGLIRSQRLAKAKFPFVRLTPAGEARARALAGLPGRDIGVMILGAVAAKTKRKPKTMNQRWCDEIKLNFGRGWDGDETAAADLRALAEIELDAMPAVSHGWLEVGSTSQGHVRYRVTQAGWRELDKPTAPPNYGKMSAEDPDAVALYRSTQDAALSELSQARIEVAGEIGPPPLVVADDGIDIVTVG